MPSGHHLRNVPMNVDALDRESGTPRHHQRKHHRAQTAAWVLLFVVAAGGLSMAAARQLDPAGFDAKLDAVVASAHNLGDKIADQFDNKEPAVNMDVTALASTAEQQPAPAAATASAPQAQSESQAPPQQLLQQQPTSAGAVQPHEAKPAPQPEAQGVTSKSTLAPPTPAAPLQLQSQPATQIQPVTPIAPVAPVTPIQPGTQSPPIPPATQPPPVTQTPPPTQGPQAEQSSI